MASRTHHAMSNQLGIAILFTTCLIPSIFSGILLPDLGNLSDKDMEDLVYSLLANSGNNNLDMDTRSWNPSTGGFLYLIAFETAFFEVSGLARVTEN